jgi:hypothetical protein
MLETLRGRFDQASRLADEAGERARRVGLPDADDVGHTLRIGIAYERDLDQLTYALQSLLPVLVRRRPGHFYEAHAARAYAMLGRPGEAAVEMERVLPRLLVGSGPRWLGAMAEVAVASAMLGDVAAATKIYDAMWTYRGRLVVFGGGVIVLGPVSHYLGLLATTLRRLTTPSPTSAMPSPWKTGSGP